MFFANSSDVQPVRCMVACQNANGGPDFDFVKIRCRQDQYDRGDHYLAAKHHATVNGYAPLLVYDEIDQAGKALLALFHWQSAETVDLTVQGEGEAEAVVYAYDVHLFPIMRLKMAGIQAKSQTEAINLALSRFDCDTIFHNRGLEYTDDIDCFLVDQVGDLDYVQSCWYQKDGVTPLY